MKIAEKIIQLAKAKNIKIASAESVTGGMIASSLISVPGASEVFLAGLIPYGSQMKKELLKIDTDKIDIYSIDCASAMSEAWQKETGADLVIATTGQAENGAKTYFAIYYKNKIITETKTFFGERNEIRQQATYFALEMIYQEILK